MLRQDVEHFNRKTIQTDRDWMSIHVLGYRLPTQGWVVLERPDKISVRKNPG
jgi:hypothetical protein